MTSEEWPAAQKDSRSLFNRIKSSYWTEKVESECTNPRQLWRSLNILTGDTSTKPYSERTAEEFATLFYDKVNNICQSTPLNHPQQLKPQIFKTSERYYQQHL